MSCKSAINTVMSTPTAVLAGGTIPLGTIIRRYGQGIEQNGNGLTIFEPGYYDVTVSITALPTAATAITATLLRDGVAVPGAVATVTPAAAGADVNMTLKALVRHTCDCGAKTLTVALNAAATVANMAVVIERV